jgi:hypothetical protein
MRARWLVPTVLVVGILSAGGPAAAGGSWLETDEQYYPPGSPATARGTFGPGAYEGRVSDGPYFAYLVPGFRWFEKPGSVPDYAVPLGPITIQPATGNYCCWVASLTFTVPDLPPGRYSIEYCNDPCTVNGIGDLLGGSFWIADNQEEARLLARIDRLEAKAESLKRIKRDLREAEAELADLQGAEAELAEVRDHYYELVSDLRAARAQDAPTQVEIPEPTARSLAPAAWALGLAALVVGAFVRRRLGRLAVPDVVPDELVQQVEAQVPERQPMTSVGRPVMSMPAPPLTKS